MDDAQWLDAASVQALGFVARRLLAEPVAMVFSLREPTTSGALDGLPQLSLDGLDEPDARALLSRAVPGRLDDRVRDRIIAETGGNPLALMELSQRMSAAERAGGFAPPAAGDLPSRLEEQYLRRVAELPEATQRLILLAAAEPLGDATLLWRAAERLSTDPGALAPAAEAGLLEIDDRVRFRHPLVRSAVYRAASLDERRRVHEALAEVSDPELDADRRAWHRALAAAGPDEAVAAELERSAGTRAEPRRPRGRGGVPRAGDRADRRPGASQAGRALAAAEASFQAGAFDAALRAPGHGGGRTRSTSSSAHEAALLRGHVAVRLAATATTLPPLLLEGGEAARAVRPAASLAETYLTAWSAAIAAHHLGGADVLLEICRAVRALPPLPADPASARPAARRASPC